MATFAATGTRADIDDLRKTMAALGTRLSDHLIISDDNCKAMFDNRLLIDGL